MDPFSTLADLVIERPGRAKVLDRLGLDYCCRGRRTLDEACRGSGLDAKRVLAEIIAGDDEPDAEPSGVGESLAALCDSIERTHHAFLREALPRVSALAERVERMHAARDPRLTRLAQVIAAFRKEMELHLLREEKVLFVWIRNLERGERGEAGLPTWGLNAPIACMEAEHEDVTDALEEMRTLTNGYTPPAWACPTYRALLESLVELEEDTRRHVHKENNILFPRAARLEGKGPL